MIRCAPLLVLLLAAGSASAAESPVAVPIEQVEGAWVHIGQDCEPDNHFDEPAAMPGSSFTLSRDYSYTLDMAGQEPRGTFTLESYEKGYLPGEWWLVVLEQAQLTFVLNVDRLETWSEESVEQCTQLFERPES